MVSWLFRLDNYISKFLGFFFIFSGFVKGIDPKGFSYKLEEILNVLEMDMFQGYSSLLSILICIAELLLGFLLLLGVWKRVVALFGWVMIAVFSVLTACFYSGVIPDITECGCFGDAFHLTNAESFWKNMVLLLIITVHLVSVFKMPRTRFRWKQLSVVCISILLAALIPVYSSLFDSPFVFLPYNVGMKISDSNEWKVLDEKMEPVSLLEDDNIPLYLVLFSDKGYAPVMNKIDLLLASHREGKVKVVILSPSPSVLERLSGTVPSYYMPESKFRMLTRSEYGVVGIKNRRIVGKWNLQSTSYRFDRSWKEELTSQLFFRTGVLVIYLTLYLLFIMIVSNWRRKDEI